MEINNSQQRLTGFTLIELVVVIALTAILASFAVARWSNISNLNAQAQQLTADIRYTQALAMTHGQRFKITFTLPANTYVIASIAGSAIPSTVTGSNTTSLGTGINFITISGLPNNLIAFDGRGTPYTDASATTVLASTASIVLAAGNQTRQIQINPAGQITVQ